MLPFLAGLAFATATIPARDYPQWGGGGMRNNNVPGQGLAKEWVPGEFDRQSGKWISDKAKNIKWVAELGSQSYGSPVIADGRVFVGTNNSAGYLRRYRRDVDLGCLLCFRERDGEFVWQFSAEKLTTGRVHDWPLMGIASSPLVEKDRAWFVSNRGEVVCVDTQGFYDDEDDGPEKIDEALAGDKREADVVWRFDMMKRLGSSQHNLATCCITSWKDTLFVCTGNGVTEDHQTIPAPRAPSFFALHKQTAEVLWTSNLPGGNIHHGQWSAPAVGLMGGVPQVVFCGGDGWVYSFHAEDWKEGKPRLLWKFDTNAKDALLELGGRGTRNEPIAPPVLHDNKVFVTTGQDPEHGEGVGCIWCIDATKKLDGSDVSPQKVLDPAGNVVPHRRSNNSPQWKEFRVWGTGFDREFDKGILAAGFRQQLRDRQQALPETIAVKTLTAGAEWELTAGEGPLQEILYVWKRWHVNEAGLRDHNYFVARSNRDRIVVNPDSAVVWKYAQGDWNGNGKIDDFYEDMHRSISSVVIHEDLLFCPDFSGLLHCLDVKSGKRHWIYDQLAACWGTPLIADGRLFVADEDGDVAIFNLSADPAKAGNILVPYPKDKDPYPQVTPLAEINMVNSVYCNPVAANGVLYIMNKNHLFAIESPQP